MRPLAFAATLSLAALLPTTQPARAAQPVVEHVTARHTGTGWTFAVTLRHPDTGWDHYADGWEVLDAKGKRLGYRKLLHPHVDEQPFTRALSGIVIPAGLTTVYVRAHCSVDGWSAPAVAVELTAK